MKIFILLSTFFLLSACASRVSFERREQYRASFIFNKCYEVFSEKYPVLRQESLEFSIDDQGAIKENKKIDGSRLKQELNKCFYNNAKRYKYTPSNREGRVSFRFKFGPAS